MKTVKTKNKISFIAFLVIYQFAMPFVLSNCGHDTPYDLTQNTAEQKPDASKTCVSQEFLTENCVASTTAKTLEVNTDEVEEGPSGFPVEGEEE